MATDLFDGQSNDRHQQRIELFVYRVLMAEPRRLACAEAGAVTLRSGSESSARSSESLAPPASRRRSWGGGCRRSCARAPTACRTGGSATSSSGCGSCRKQPEETSAGLLRRPPPPPLPPPDRSARRGSGWGSTKAPLRRNKKQTNKQTNHDEIPSIQWPITNLVNGVYHERRRRSWKAPCGNGKQQQQQQQQQQQKVTET